MNQKPYKGMKEMVKSMEETVETFVGNAPQHDDFTILAFRYLGERSDIIEPHSSLQKN